MNRNETYLEMFSQIFLSLFLFFSATLDLPSQFHVVPTKALMPTMLVQEYKDKTITHTVHEVLRGLTICLHPRNCRDINIIIEEYRVQPQRLQYFLSIYNTATTPH